MFEAHQAIQTTKALQLALLSSASMPLKLHRFYSSSSAASIAAQFLSKAQSLPPLTQTQLLDPNQLQRLSATLSRSELSKSLSTCGTPLPACYHLAYFTPSQLEDELGPDGTDISFTPPSPFIRRMWAGGELEWVGTEKNVLRVGQEVIETTRLISSVGKVTRSGEEMVVVGVEKTFENKHGIALIDKRNWIFRPTITIPRSPTPRPPEVPLPEGKYFQDFIQTPVTLFRFSALTLNGHKIHYNKEWCQDVEGHRDIVVHGPLNLIIMVNFWRDVRGLPVTKTPRRVTYRATSPLYAGEKYRVIIGEEADKKSDVRIVDNYGAVSMLGQIESF